MNAGDIERLRHLLADLAESLTSAALAAADIRTILDPAMARGDGSGRDGRLPPPRVNRSMFCVEWEGRACFLGSTRTFHLLECLARRPNRYVSHAQLLSDVWRGDVKEVETIRSVVRHLRDKLRRAKMHALADAIVGTGQAYGLVLSRTR